MSMGTYRKQPADERDIDIDCADWLEELGGDMLDSATVSVSPSGLTVETPVVSASSVKVWVRGGTDGETYTVSVTVETVGARVKQAEFKVRVKDK